MLISFLFLVAVFLLLVCISPDLRRVLGQFFRLPQRVSIDEHLNRRRAAIAAQMRAKDEAARLSRQALDALKIMDIVELVEKGWAPPEHVTARLKAEAKRLEAEAKRLADERDRKHFEHVEKRLAAGEKVSQADLRLIADARIAARRTVRAYTPLDLANAQARLAAAGIPYESVHVAEQVEPVAIHTGSIVSAGKGPGSLTITSSGVTFNPTGHSAQSRSYADNFAAVYRSAHI